jgi:hypothetical protein
MMLHPEEPLAANEVPSLADLTAALHGALETYTEANDNQGLHAEKLVPVIEANLNYNGWKNIPADTMEHALWATGMFSDVSTAAEPRPAGPGQVVPDFGCRISGVQDSPMFYLTANTALREKQLAHMAATNEAQLAVRRQVRQEILEGKRKPPAGFQIYRIPPKGDGIEQPPAAFDPHATHRVGKPAPRKIQN